MVVQMDFILGAIFVFFYSMDRISKPKMNMESTTVQRYWSMLIIYALASVALYLILSLTLQKLMQLPDAVAFMKSLANVDGTVTETVKKTLEQNTSLNLNMSPALLVALFMTVFMSKIPLIARFDEAIRDEFRHRASMSSIAANLSHLLESAPLNLSSEKRKRIVKDLQEQEIERKDVTFENDGSPQYLWTRISVLLDSLKSWETDSTYRNFVARFRGEWESLIEESELHEAKAIRCFRLGCVAGKDEKLISALKDCRHHYAEQLNGLMRQLSDFMGRGIAHSRRNAEARRAALVSIGIDARVNVGYTYHQISWLFAMALVVTIVVPMLVDVVGSFFLSNVANSETDTKGNISLQAYMFKIAFSYACAGFVALYIRYRKGSSPGDAQNRPWGRYLVTGLLAVVAATMIGFMVDWVNLPIRQNELTAQQESLLVKRKELQSQQTAALPQLQAVIASQLVKIDDKLQKTTRSLQNANMHGIFVRFADNGWKFQIRTLVLAILLSYLLDTPVTKGMRRRQWIDMGLTAGVMTAVAAVTIELLGKTNFGSNTNFYIVFMLSSLALGAWVGYWLPNSARLAEQKPPEHIEMEPDADEATVVI